MSSLDQLSAALADRYDIERELGRGGMATVYLARDRKHDRSVAIKVLNPELGAMLGAERFLAEIKVTATLQHPNLLPLFDSGEVNGLLYYVMPYLEGETLRARLQREQQLPIEDAVRIATGIAHALSYAHARNVVHRDLKPENVLLQHGQPVVLDFGIALAMRNAGGPRMTQTGVSIGTPQYMSPEQAAGEKLVDARSDIFALGALLYEMLAGETPHSGPTAQIVIAKVMSGDVPPVTRMRPSVPTHIVNAVHKALSRVPADRFSNADELIRALQTPVNTGETVRAQSADFAALAVSRSSQRRALIATSALAVVSTVVALWAFVRTRPPAAVASAADIEFQISPDSTGERLSVRDVSRDGRTLLLRKGNRFYLRALNSTELTPLPAEISGDDARFSPDARFVVVRVEDALRVAPVNGGVGQPLVKLQSTGTFLWGSDDRIYFQLVGLTGIGRVAPSGGAIDTVLRAESASVSIQPTCVLEGGDAIVFARVRANQMRYSEFDLRLYRVKAKTTSNLFAVPSGSAFACDSRGTIYYTTGGALLARVLDVESGTVATQVSTILRATHTVRSFALGGSTLVASEQAASDFKPFLASANGPLRPLPLDSSSTYRNFTASPDGKSVAMLRFVNGGSSSDVWLLRLADGRFTRATTTGATGAIALDSQGTLYFAHDLDVYRQGIDLSTPQLVLHRPRPVTVITLDEQNRRLFFQEGPGNWDIGVTALPSTGTDSLLVHSTFWEGHPAVSPDGKWLAYYSAESRAAGEIMLQQLVPPYRRTQLTKDGGRRPRWARRGNALFYFQPGPSSNGGALILADLSLGSEPRVLRSKALLANISDDFAVLAGDTSFVVMTNDRPSSAPRPLTVIVNVDRRVGGNAVPGDTLH